MKERIETKLTGNTIQEYFDIVRLWRERGESGEWGEGMCKKNALIDRTRAYIGENPKSSALKDEKHAILNRIKIFLLDRIKT